jgi:hypothetical protein
MSFLKYFVDDWQHKQYISTHTYYFARLALTRARARCLRDALNIGLCAVEELGG